MPEEAKQSELGQKTITIDQAAIALSNALNKIMVKFDSDNDKVDFILDIVDEFRKQFNDGSTKGK